MIKMLVAQTNLCFLGESEKIFFSCLMVVELFYPSRTLYIVQHFVGQRNSQTPVQSHYGRGSKIIQQPMGNYFSSHTKILKKGKIT